MEIDHLAATLFGMKVTITATVAEVKGRAVVFDVSATDGLDTICRGRHARFVANVEQVEAAPEAEAGEGRGCRVTA